MILKSPRFLLFFVAATTGSTPMAAALYTHTPLDIVLIVTSGAITFAVYGINRFTDTEDSINDNAKAEFFKKHSYLLHVSILVLVISVGLLLLAKKFTFYHIFLYYPVLHIRSK